MRRHRRHERPSHRGTPAAAGRVGGAVGRLLLATPFVILGYEAAREPGNRVELAAKIGVPRPDLAVRGNGLAMVAGGVALSLGVLPRAASAGLAASLVPTTLAGHAFWEDDDPATRKANRIQFLKNVGLAGGLAVLAVRRGG